MVEKGADMVSSNLSLEGVNDDKIRGAVYVT